MTLGLLGLTSDPQTAVTLATASGGTAWTAHEEQRRPLPYEGGFFVASDRIDDVTTAADVGLHVCFRRVIKPPSGTAPAERVIASFGMVRHKDLTHRQSDDHWRDTHGPLALECHLAMCDYEQLSIIATLHGEPLDGLAMCAFPSRPVLSEKFFNDDAARDRVIADVATFANTRASLPRVVLTQAV